jgi:hypothetical protein
VLHHFPDRSQFCLDDRIVGNLRRRVSKQLPLARQPADRRAWFPKVITPYGVNVSAALDLVDRLADAVAWPSAIVFGFSKSETYAHRFRRERSRDLGGGGSTKKPSPCSSWRNQSTISSPSRVENSSGFFLIGHRRKYPCMQSIRHADFCRRSCGYSSRTEGLEESPSGFRCDEHGARLGSRGLSPCITRQD